MSHYCPRCGYESRDELKVYFNDHPYLSVLVVIWTVLWSVGALIVYPWIMIATASLFLTAYQITRKINRQNALRDRFDYDTR